MSLRRLRFFFKNNCTSFVLIQPRWRFWQVYNPTTSFARVLAGLHFVTSPITPSRHANFHFRDFGFLILLFFLRSKDKMREQNENFRLKTDKKYIGAVAQFFTVIFGE